MNALIGIDFGTVECRIAYPKDENVVVLPNHFLNSRMFPIFEYLHERKADRESFCFTSLKQKMGFQEQVVFDGRKVMALDLVSNIFRSIREEVKQLSGQDISCTVVAVPSCFVDKQRAAVRKAAEKAGFDSVRLVDESLAALIALGLKGDTINVLVYSLGGGIFTVSLFQIVNGNPRALWHEGDRKLGGNEFDTSIINFIIDKAGFDRSSLNLNSTSLKKLKFLAEQLKIELSNKMSIEVDINIRDYFGNVADRITQNNLKFILTRAEFENMIHRFIEKTISFAKKAVQEAGLTNNDIDSVVLIGGSSRIPLVERMVREEFGKEFILASDELIATGAAMYGAQIAETTMKDKVQPETKIESLQPKSEIQKTTEPSQTDDMNWLNEFSPYLIDSQLLWNRGKQDEAIVTLEKLLQQLPKFIANLYYNRGEALLNTEKISEAIIYLEKGLVHNKNSSKIQRAYHKACNKTAIMLLESGNISEAKSIVQKGLIFEPNCSGCLDLLKQVDAMMKMKDLQLGLSKFRRKKRR